MKHISYLDVKTDGSLKVKKRTLVVNSYEANSNSKGKIREKEHASVDHATIRDVDD